VQRADGRRRTAGVGQHHPAHSPDPGLLLGVAGSEQAGLAHPAFGAVVPAAQALHVGQLPACASRDLGLRRRLRDADRLMEEAGAFAVPAADGVDEGRAEGEQGPGLQPGGTGLVRSGDRLPEAGDRNVGRTRVERGQTGLQLGGDAGGRRRTCGGLAWVRDDGGAPDGVARFEAELPAEERDAGVPLAPRRRRVAGRGVGADEQLLRVLVEWIRGDQAGRQLHRLPRIPSCELGQGGLPQHVVRGCRQSAAFGQEPDLERR
jgi:hypothetical protein